MPHRPESMMLTGPEAEIMNVLWNVGEATVAEVVERLPRELAYTTVMTTIRILEEKGFVANKGKRGRAFVYAAAVEKSAVTGSMTSEVANRLFGGSVKSLVLNMISDPKVNHEDLAEIKQLIEQLEARK
ncbi:Penicillinase repressor [Posidoniimonas polymericola]|uniref:Penicillinase repressor n=1 Tax=Posidoniimonas polymericola TaxID=2528002 RepID=A0A5C5YMW4_9BACT|nr:BlaI/MecI/CopY family transcriptional regulator [Posidoniimonas polymericola]TWT76157.1 Penicillinase repressor [Posidoniimonas polymericola]